MWPNPICPPAPKSGIRSHFSVPLVAALCCQSLHGASFFCRMPMLHLPPPVTKAFLKHQSDHPIPSLSPSPMLTCLRWLPIANQMTFKGFTLVFKATPCPLVNCYTTFPPLCLCSKHPFRLLCFTTSYLKDLPPPKSSSSLTSSEIPSLTLLARRDLPFSDLVCFLP